MKTIKNNLISFIAIFSLLCIAATTSVTTYQTAVEIRKNVKNPKTLSIKYLDSTGVGDTTVPYNAILDYADSAASDTYLFAPDSGTVYYVNSLTVQIQDTGIFDINEYGDTTSLTKGIDFIFTNNGAAVTRYNPYYIRTNADYMKYANSFYMVDGLLIAKFNFQDIGYPIRLRGDSSDYFGVVLQDSLSYLYQHQFIIHGFYE